MCSNIYIYIYILYVYIHTYISAQLPYIVSNSKTCMTVGNQKTNLWYLTFHAVWQSSVITLYSNDTKASKAKDDIR